MAEVKINMIINNTNMDERDHKAMNKDKKIISSKRMLIAGDLRRGEHFRLRKNGKYYTVHCQVISIPIHDSDEFDRMHYTLAVSSGKMFVFDTEMVVIACN